MLTKKTVLANFAQIFFPVLKKLYSPYKRSMAGSGVKSRHRTGRSHGKPKTIKANSNLARGVSLETQTHGHFRDETSCFAAFLSKSVRNDQATP